MHSELVVVILTAVSTVTCQQCVDYLRSVEHDGYRLEFDGPTNYYQASDKCRHRDGHLPSWREMQTNQGHCGGQLVPLASTDGCLVYNGTLEDHNDSDIPVFDVTSGKCMFVDSGHLFSCVLCRYNDIRFPINRVRAGWEDMTASQRFVVHLTSTDVRETTAVDVDALRDELDTLLKPAFKESIKFNTSLLDQSRHLLVDFRVENSPIAASVANDKATTLILNDTFTMTFEDVGFCPSGEIEDKDGAVTLWPRTMIDDFQLYKSLENANILHRYCYFDVDAFQGKWDPMLTRWELVYRPCSSLDDQYSNEETYKQFLDAADIDARHANMLHSFVSAPINSTGLEEVTQLVAREMALKNELDEQIVWDLATVLASLDMESNQQVVVMENRAYLIAAHIETPEPVVGFACHCNVMSYEVGDSIMLETTPMTQQRIATTPIAVNVSSSLMTNNSRVAFVVLWKDMQNRNFYLRSQQYFEVIVMLPLGSPSKLSKHYVDITYFPERFFEELFMKEEENALYCVAWNDDLRDWTSRGCEILHTNRNGSSACRCSGKYFVFHGGVPIGKFALKKSYVRHKLACYNSPLGSGASSPWDRAWEQCLPNLLTLYFAIYSIMTVIMN